MIVEVSARLREARKKKGCTADAVAKACGITANAVYMYENGYRVPRDEVKKALAQFYEIPVQDLFF